MFHDFPIVSYDFPMTFPPSPPPGTWYVAGWQEHRPPRAPVVGTQWWENNGNFYFHHFHFHGTQKVQVLTAALLYDGQSLKTEWF